MHIISFDVATKSLGVSIINYNLELSNEINLELNLFLKKKEMLLSSKFNSDDFNNLLKNYVDLLDIVAKKLDEKIKIEFLEVVDLIPGKKLKETTIIERTKNLQIYLTNLDKLLPKTPLIFLVEYQMGPNDKSRVISSQILYHFSKFCINNNNAIHLIGPSLKNKIIIGGIDSKYSIFLEKYKTNYTANKAHAKYNFLKLITFLKKETLIKDIKAKNIDDIADSVLMSLAYLLSNFIF